MEYKTFRSDMDRAASLIAPLPYRKLAQIVTGLFLANYLWSSSAVAADYELNVDNPDLIECSGDDYTATHQAMVVYKDQISQKTFSISTQGYTPDTDDFIAGVFSIVRTMQL